MSHRWLIAVSMTAHLTVAAGLFTAGAWKIQRLDRPKLPFDITQPGGPPPAPSGGPVPIKVPEFQRKVHVTHDHVQPVTTPPKQITPSTGDAHDLLPGPKSDDPDPHSTCTENCGPPTPAVATPVCGDGARDASEQCDDGNNLNGDGCSATCRIEVKPAPLAVVAPSVLQGLRISGTTQVHPSDVTQSQMLRDGADRVAGTVKLCISTDGNVASAKMLSSTKYDAYDATLLQAVYGWHYQPYAVGGTAVPACSTVTFVYKIQ